MTDSFTSASFSAWPAGSGELLLRALVATGAASLYRMSADWRLMYQLDSHDFLATTSEPIEDWADRYILEEDRPHVFDAIARAIETRTTFELEHRVALADGSVGWVLSRAVPMFGPGGEITEWFGAGNDITPRKRAEKALRESEERQAFLLRLSDALRSLTDSGEIERLATRLLGEHLQADRCFLSPVTEDGIGMCVREEYLRAGASSVLGDYTFAQFGDFVGPELHAGRILAVENVSALTGLNAAERASYAATEIQAYLLIPLVRDGRLAAFLTINHRTQRAWSDADKAVAQQTADRLWTARERGRVEEALNRSEARLRMLFDSIDEGYAEMEMVLGDDGRVVDWRYLALNPALKRLTGMEDVTGRLISEILPGLEPEWAERYTTLLKTGEPIRFELPAAQLGQWFEVYCARIGGADSRRVVAVYNDVTTRKHAEKALRESEERQAFLLKLSDALRPLTGAREIKAAAAVVVSEWLDIASAGYAETEPGGLTSVITDEYNDGRIPSLMARYTLADFSSVTEPMKRGETIHFADLDGDGVSVDTRAAFTAINVRAAVAVPLIKNGLMVAYLFVAHPLPRAWTASDLEILREVAERTWAAVERARAEEELRESEMRFRTLADTAPAFIWFNDELGKNVFVNQAFLDYTGRSPDQVTGERWHDLVHPDQAGPYIASYMEAVRAQMPWRGRNLLRRFDGGWHWCDNYARPLFRADGSYRGHVGILIDVDEKVRAEQALSESEERKALLLKLSDTIRPMRDAFDIQQAAVKLLGDHLQVSRAGYYEVESDQNTFFLTARWEREAIPLPDRMVLTDFGEEIREGYRAGRTMVARDTEQDAASQDNLAAVRAIKVRAWIGYPLVKEGRWVAAVGVHSAVPRDWTATELRLVEEVGERTWSAVERARAETALRESETLRRVALAGGRMGTWRWDLQAALIWGDAQFWTLWGYPPSDDPRPLSDFNNRMSPQSTADVAAVVASAIKAGEQFDGPLEIVTGPNAGRWLRWQGRADENNPSRLYGVSFDITEQKQAEAQLRESEERQAFLLKLSDALRPLSNPSDIQDVAARIVGNYLGADRAYYAYVEGDYEFAVVEREYVRGDAPSVVGRHRFADFDAVRRAYLTGQNLIVDDVEAPGVSSASDLAAYRAISVRSYLGVLLIKNGAAVASMNVLVRTPHHWTLQEIALLEEAAERTWAAVERARAEQALRETEEERRSLITEMNEGFCILEVILDDSGNGVDYRFLETNPAFVRQGGFDPQSRLMSEIAPIEPVWPAAYGRVATTGVPERIIDAAAAFGRTYDVYAFRVGAPASRRIAVFFTDITVRMRVERNADFLDQIGQDLARLSAPEDITQCICARLGKYLNLSACILADVDANDADVTLYHGWTKDGPPALKRSFRLGDYLTESFVQTNRAGQPFVVRDTMLDNRVHKDSYAKLNVAALVGIPFHRNERWVGYLAATDTQTRDWRDDEIQLLKDVSDRLFSRLERARSETALRESEERLRQFGEASQDVLWARDAESFQWEYLTPAFETIYGLSRSEALSGDNMTGWVELILPEDRARAVSCLRHVRDGEEVTFEYRIRRPSDGEIRWLRNTDFPIRDGAGRVVRIGGIGTDITEMRNAHARLAEIEHRQRALIEGMPQLVWRAVDSGIWTWASPQWTAYTGQSELESHGWGWLETVHPDDRDDARAAWAVALAAGGFEVEYRILGVQKEYRWFQTRAMPVRGDDSGIIEWLGTSTDIHDLRALQDRQKVLVAELQHRTRNLIGVVRSMAEKSARASSGLDDFRARFRDRLDALARVQGLLSRLGEKERVTFDALIETEMSAMGYPEQIALTGPRGIALRSAMVQTLALALHELATNAVKYGALSQPDAKLSVTWTLEQEGADRPWLHVDWRESNVRMPQQTASRGGGHGRELIERALPYQLSAKTSFVLEPDGAHCTISIPV